MTATPYELTRKWYEAFEQDEFIASRPGLDADNISEDRAELKMKLIVEECFELVGAFYGKQAEEILNEAYKKAVAADDGTRDFTEVIDALGDIPVVTAGMCLEIGVDQDRVNQIVFESNMSKLGRDGKPVISDGVTPAEYDGEIKPAGKLLKGPDFKEPDFTEFTG